MAARTAALRRIAAVVPFMSGRVGGIPQRYLKELGNAEAADALAKLYHFAAGRKKLTLLFAAKNEQRNHAVVLKDLLEGMRKPPTGTGAGAAGKARQPKVMRMRR